jgi:hypothetical protein
VQCCIANFDLVFNRFDRLWLKNEPTTTVDPATQDDIAVLHKHVCSLFPGVDPQHIQKKDVQKNETIDQWIKKHCRITQHVFQVRECDDDEC